jgi:glycosyltransferase involved in cell wall biosynthesis
VNEGSLPMRTDQPPRVTVVVVTYMRADLIGRCLDSLAAQTFKDFDVLVCDDGSTDNTAEVVEQFKGKLQVEYCWRENFGGPARPRNIGLQMARAQYVAFLDSDDWWQPEKLEKSVAVLDSGSDLVYHDLYVVSSPKQRVFWQRYGKRTIGSPPFVDLLGRGNAICNSSVVVRTEALRSVGGFSEDRGLIAWEDYEAWLRVAKVAPRFARLPEPLGYYWMAGGNMTNARRTINNFEHFRKMYFTPDSPWTNGALPGWCNYALGRAYYMLGNYSVALDHLRKASEGDIGLVKRAKTWVTRVACHARMVFRPAGMTKS